MLLALLLAAAPTGFYFQDEGVAKGLVTKVNCSGAGITCSTYNGTGTIAVSSGGTGATVPPACSSGQVVTSNGTDLVCTATVTASNVTCTSCIQSAEIEGAVATATALAADPADCSAGQYATSIAASGALTCAGVTGGQVSGAVATATALAADPADCTSNRYATAINASGTLTCAQVDLAAGVTGTLPPANGGASSTQRVLTSNYTNSTVTPSTILSWSIAAGAEQGFYCVLNSTGTATSLVRFNVNGPGSPTTVSFATRRFTTTSAETLLVLQAFSAAAQTAACTSTCTTTVLPSIIYGTILNGSNAGTVSLQGASSTAAQSVTVHRGSYCRVF